MRKRSQQGITLVEILVATLIFCVALTGVLGSMVAISDLIDLSKDTTTATVHLKNMMERVLMTSFATMLTRFPNGTVDGPVTNPYASVVGGYNLTNEHITALYANMSTDPLEINVFLSWSDKKGRGRNISMSTFKTR
jgi:type II secretory pathway component PulJ